MGESIEMVIKECKNSLEDGLQDTKEEMNCNLDVNKSYIDIGDAYEEETAISSDHALILACSWQTMKVGHLFTLEFGTIVQ